MPRDLIAEIGPIVASQQKRIKEFLQRRGLLQTPQQTLEAEWELASLMRNLADEVMEKLIVASVEAQQKPGQPSQIRRAGAAGRKTRSMGQRLTTIRLLGGRLVSLKTRYRLPVGTVRPGRRRGTGRRGKAGAGYFPSLLVLGILCGATPAVLSEVARQTAESSSYQIAQQNLGRRGLDLTGAQQRGASPSLGGGGMALVMQLLTSGGGLGGLVQAFQQQGLGSLVASWVGAGQNLPISADQLRSVLGVGEDRLQQLAAQARMSSDAAAAGLAQSLPTAVDTMTPAGSLPEDGALPDLGSLLR